MTLKIVSGDPLLTDAPVLAFGHNAKGQIETDALHSMLMQQYPAAFAQYKRRCRQGKQFPGEMWLWTQSHPKLLFLTVRNSSVGATRLRYVQAVFLTLARDYLLYGFDDLALMLPGNPAEQDDILPLCETWLTPSPLAVTLYTTYQPGILPKK